MARRRSVIDCIFCGARGVQRGREDVLPVWLAGKLSYRAQQFHPNTPTTYRNYSYGRLTEFQKDMTVGT